MPVVPSSAFSSAGDAFELIRAMLNDADIPSVSNITPTGAVRVSNVVTITTTSVHGLMPGMRVNVTAQDTSFNGTFTVATVPTTTTFTYLQVGSDVSSGSGIVQLLIEGDVYTDAVLLPLVNEAYRVCQSEMFADGSKTLIRSEVLTLAAGGTEFSATSDPILFPDFLSPRELFQKIAGSTNRYFAMGAPVNELPDIPAATYAQNWSWREDGLYFNEATSDLDIKIRYNAGLQTVSASDSEFIIRGILSPVASYGAYLAAQSRGNPQSLIFKQKFDEDITRFLNMQEHARQYQPVRRFPYGNSGRGNFNQIF